MFSRENKPSLEQLLDYFDNKLTAEEVKTIDHLIKEDASFADEVNLLYGEWLKSPEGIRLEISKFQKDFYSSIAQIASEATETRKSKPTPKFPWPLIIRRYIGPVAAVFLLLLIARGTGLWFYPCSVDDAGCLIDESGGLPFERFTDMGDVNTDSLIQVIAKAYSAGDFDGVVEQNEFISELELSPFQQNEYNYLLGLSLLKTDKLERAISTFENILDSDDPYYAVNSKWYAALALIELDRIKETKPLLESVKMSGSNKSADAKILLKRLWWKTMF